MSQDTYTESFVATGLIEGFSLISIKQKDLFRRYDEIDLEWRPNHSLIFSYNVSGITLMAAILEGSIRQLLSREISARSEGVSIPEQLRKYQEHFRRKIELEGGWGNLLQFYISLYDESLAKRVGAENWEAISHLMTIRNCTAHGTTIRFPDTPIPDDKKEYYPYLWQQQLKKCSDYLTAKLGDGDINEHLKSSNLLEFFWEYVKNASGELVKTHGGHSKLTRSLHLVTKYGCGYIFIPDAPPEQ